MFVNLLTLCAFLTVCVSAGKDQKCPEKCTDELHTSMTSMSSLVGGLKYTVTADLTTLTHENLQLKDRLQYVETENMELRDSLDNMEANNTKLHETVEELERRVAVMQAIFNRIDFKRWGNWMEWSNCSVTCGKGIITRSRKCIGNVPLSYSCLGDEEEVEEKDCEVTDCIKEVQRWGNWSNWSNCSASCGVGITTRERSCIGDIPDDDSCIGEGKEEKECQGTECGEVCPVRRGSICFIVLASSSSERPSTHYRECRRKGGRLGNVYDEKHLLTLGSYLTEKGYLSGVITGMKYRSNDEGIRLSDGSLVDLPWLPGYPRNERRMMNVLVKIASGSKPLSVRNVLHGNFETYENGQVAVGVVNAHYNDRSRYSLCEIDIEELLDD